MEQQEQRRMFVNQLNEFCKLVVLNKEFWNGLRQHSYNEYLKEVEKFKDDFAKKTFIFLEFTRGRSSCNEMIQILKESGPENEKAAIKLEHYNTSPKFMEESYEIELKVTPAKELYGPSKCFEMNKKPRGLFLLINNLSSIITKESLRFKNIFEQLLFDVELLYDKTADEMKEKFESLAKNRRLLNDQALVVMIISHGYNDKVEGVDKKVLSVRSIVDIFSEDNCKLLYRKPKLFFFNCCRDITEYIPAKVKRDPEEYKLIIELENVVTPWKCANEFTMISFACAEGDGANFDLTGFTHYGQALSHCIAQYACDKSVQSILNLTGDRMGPIGSTEVRLLKINRELFLNPGLTKKV